MKNRKRFQKFMLSAIALTTLIPFTSQTGIVHAKWDIPKDYKGEINVQAPIKSQYSVANTKANGSTKAISPYIAIAQNSKNGNAMANYADSKTSGFLVENKGLSGQSFGGKKS